MFQGFKLAEDYSVSRGVDYCMKYSTTSNNTSIGGGGEEGGKNTAADQYTIRQSEFKPAQVKKYLKG